MACLGLMTFLPPGPDLSVPCFIAFISRSTFLPAEGEYLRREEDFFALVLLRVELVLLRALVFFAALFRAGVFLAPLDLFLAALVAITILPRKF